MQNFSFSQLEDRSLLKSFRSDVAARRGVTARILAQLAEIDERKLYLLEAYTSFRAFCVSELRCSRQKGYKWIQVARAVGKFPALLEAIADGRLTRTGVIILAPHLDEANSVELIAAASGKAATEIERLLAERTARMKQMAEAQAPVLDDAENQLSARIVENAPAADSAPSTRPDLTLSAPDEETLIRLVGTDCELLRLAKDLVAHAIPSRDSSRVVARALREMIERAQKQKYGKGVQTRKGEPSESTSPRYVSAHVRWAVRQRDGEQCTYVSPDGRRCEATSHLEYDHIVPVARGGQATVENLRMRCRGHNQFEAERTFGREFMKEKRAAAKAERGAAEARKPFDGDVVRCLRRMGFHVDEAQEAAANSGASPDEKIEERVRAALQWLGRAPRKAG
jgi:5-methylcytosine-specific restriction endonuclease McrA